MSIPTPGNDDELRKEAVKRVKAKQGAKQLTGIFLIVWAILIGVWWTSGGGYFWPGWAIFGMGIGLAFTWFGAYGPPKSANEAQIEAEMRKLQGG